MDFNRKWTQFAIDAEYHSYGAVRLADAHNRLRVQIDQLRIENNELRRMLAHERHRADRLQMALDSRPALNAGLYESYIRWSEEIGTMEFMRAVCQEN